MSVFGRMFGLRSVGRNGWNPPSSRSAERVASPDGVGAAAAPSLPRDPLASDEWRAVPISHEQQRQLESLGFALIRAGVEDGSSGLVLGLALAWRVSPVIEPPIVPELEREIAEAWATNNVVPLDPYSRKV